ncbi:MAG: 4-(cytidine 5'-diphospho)-2-C-methyl-D-erythritol kinase [Planctomycetota bacterium]
MSRPPSAVTLRSPAKVNLFLEVVGKRPDGYHELATVMTALSLHDRLTFRPSRRLALSTDHPDLTTGPENLILRAVRALQQAAGTRRGARITLEKRIPIGGGLGGGSGNAATTLAGLNRLWRLGFSRETLLGIAGSIGSDTTFFLRQGTALCRGRGEVVTPVPSPPPLDLVIVFPGFPVSTPAVYRRPELDLTAPRRSATIFLRSLRAGQPETIGRALFNRLENAAFALEPRLVRLTQALEHIGCAGTLLAGSGASVFGLCRDRAEAGGNARRLRKKGYRTVFVCRTTTTRTC